MKYTSEIIIDKPLEHVVPLYDNHDNMFKWMDGLKKVTPLTSVQGEIGSRMEMYFELGTRKFHLIETILDKNLPSYMSCKYKSFGMENIIHIYFEPIQNNQTIYRTESEYKFKGIFNLMKLFSSKMFKKKSHKYLVNFKIFAEKNN